MVQEIFAFALLGLAVFFLVRKFFFNNSKKKKSGGCGSDCGCN